MSLGNVIMTLTSWFDWKYITIHINQGQVTERTSPATANICIGFTERTQKICAASVSVCKTVRPDKFGEKISDGNSCSRQHYWQKALQNVAKASFLQIQDKNMSVWRFELNTSDAFLFFFLFVKCSMVRWSKEMLSLLAHINCPGMKGRVCLCVFTLGACCVPDGLRDKSEGERDHGK